MVERQFYELLIKFIETSLSNLTVCKQNALSYGICNIIDYLSAIDENIRPVDETENKYFDFEFISSK
jgi:hypothetical protein